MVKVTYCAFAVVAVVTIAIAHAPKTTTATISGPARIIDGDTVVVGTAHVRLKGVDAAEMGTPRGDAARLAMIGIVGSGPLTCSLTGEHTYKREVGYCFTDKGVDINRAIVESGAALACPRYDTRYQRYETAAAIKAQERAPYCISR